MLASRAAKCLPDDFVVASQTGGAFTLITYAVMLFVFLNELKSFTMVQYTTMLMLDRRDGDSLQINFDVDMFDIECRNLRVSVFAQASEESLSTDTQDFWLRPIDISGKIHGMAHKPQERLAYDDGEEQHAKIMAELLKHDGKKELDSDWASSHDGFHHQSFDHVIQAHDFTFINFFAGWCSHCQRFSPTWDRLAITMHGNGTTPPQEFLDKDGVKRTVRLIKLNCVDFQKLCMEKGIDAFPTLRLYKADGSFSLFDAKRGEVEITGWLERTIKVKSYGWGTHHETFEKGCNAKGRLKVPRVPGHLEFTAGGGDQNLNTRMTNVSHFVKHLSFSDPGDGKYHRQSWNGLPQDVLTHLSPLDGQRFITQSYHQAWIHDMKVVSTISHSGATAYQVSHQKRLSRVGEHIVPQTKFYFDIEPFSIWVKRDNKEWYDLCTSTLAILGGSFVIMRMLSRFAVAVLSLRLLGPRHGLRGGSMNVGSLD